MSSFYTCVSKITIIWCMLPEISNATDNLLSFWVMFYSLPHSWPENLKIWEIEKMPGRIISLHLCITIDDHMMYVSQDAEHDRHNFLSFWTAIYLLPTKKIKILKKWKESSGDVTILHMCSKNHDHIMYASWDIECDRQSFVIWVIFCSLPHYWLKKLKFWDIEKMPGRIISLNLCITIDNHMMYVSQDAEHDRHNFLSFWTAIYLLTTRKIKILKKWEDSSGDVIILQMCIKNHDHMMYASWDIECDRQSFVILGHVLPFTPLLTRKLKNLRDWKNAWTHY